MTDITSNDDIIDVRDITDRVEELRESREEYDEQHGAGAWAKIEDGEPQELEALESLLDDIRGYGGDHQWEGDWYPLMLIRDSHFEEHAVQLAEDIGAIDSSAKWPNNCIDWAQAARELQHDYSSVEFDGVTYWHR
ncbi:MULTISPECIES: hypothetical protein [Burkholderia]|uniref:hypothetical protein n=1 Tax=Burkholderia TaxID=32008 RepID=UPI0008418865|nr:MULTISPECIES: hypothetical protein [unclassified Burkholderia]AOK28898.1 hypothetical protein AQ611_05085 [Burkholderia sp. Bp7605]